MDAIASLLASASTALEAHNAVPTDQPGGAADLFSLLVTSINQQRPDTAALSAAAGLPHLASDKPADAPTEVLHASLFSTISYQSRHVGACCEELTAGIPFVYTANSESKHPPTPIPDHPNQTREVEDLSELIASGELATDASIVAGLQASFAFSLPTIDISSDASVAPENNSPSIDANLFRIQSFIASTAIGTPTSDLIRSENLALNTVFSVDVASLSLEAGAKQDFTTFPAQPVNGDTLSTAVFSADPENSELLSIDALRTQPSFAPEVSALKNGSISEVTIFNAAVGLPTSTSATLEAPNIAVVSPASWTTNDAIGNSRRERGKLLTRVFGQTSPEAATSPNVAAQQHSTDSQANAVLVEIKRTPVTGTDNAVSESNLTPRRIIESPESIAAEKTVTEPTAVNAVDDTISIATSKSPTTTESANSLDSVAPKIESASRPAKPPMQLSVNPGKEFSSEVTSNETVNPTLELKRVLDKQSAASAIGDSSDTKTAFTTQSVPNSAPRAGTLTSQLLTAVVQQLSLINRPDPNTLTLRLDPPELGEVQVEFRQSDNGVQVRVEARDVVTMEMLVSRGSEIEKLLKAQDLDVTKVEFMQAESESSQSGQRNSDSRDQRRDDWSGSQQRRGERELNRNLPDPKAADTPVSSSRSRHRIRA